MVSTAPTDTVTGPNFCHSLFGGKQQRSRNNNTVRSSVPSFALTDCTTAAVAAAEKSTKVDGRTVQFRRSSLPTASLPACLPSQLLALATCQSEALRERRGGRERAPLSSSHLSPFIPFPSKRAPSLLPPSCRGQSERNVEEAEGRGAKTNTAGAERRTVVMGARPPARATLWGGGSGQRRGAGPLLCPPSSSPPRQC